MAETAVALKLAIEVRRGARVPAALPAELASLCQRRDGEEEEPQPHPQLQPPYNASASPGLLDI